jgi:hypothetical protein
MKIIKNIVPCYVDSANNTHQSKLEFLMAERNLAMRGVIQSDPNCGKNVAFTPAQVVKLALDNSKAIADVANTFEKAIRKERAKANPVINTVIQNRMNGNGVLS